MATLDAQQLNSIKSKMSIAYLHGVNAIVNYVMSETNRDIDGLGIDFVVFNKTIGPGRKVASEANQINIQLKGVSINSKSMIEETKDSIKYTLGKSLQPVGTHYLVILVLPDEKYIETWREVTSELLTLRKCAYYFHITKTLKPGKIVIPKQNVLNPESFVKLFDAAKKKDAI